MLQFFVENGKVENYLFFVQEVVAIKVIFAWL